ncbi:MAG: hypothetical protein ACI97R_001563, partial [Candidatus Azotimanducaceae bacterium]
ASRNYHCYFSMKNLHDISIGLKASETRNIEENPLLNPKFINLGLPAFLSLQFQNKTVYPIRLNVSKDCWSALYS